LSAAPPGAVVDLFSALEVAGCEELFGWAVAGGGEFALTGVPALGSAAGVCAGVVDWALPDGGGTDCCGGNFVADGAVGSCCSGEFWAASPHGSAASKTRITQVFIRNFIIAACGVRQRRSFVTTENTECTEKK
jgi:hypothetical protein